MALATDADDMLAAAVAHHSAAADVYRVTATRARDLARMHESHDRASIPALMRCVVVLDDDAGARGAMAAMLRAKLAVDVYEAATPAGARVLIAAHRPAVVVVDYVLRSGRTGSTSGLAFVAELPRMHRAVLVSGHAHLDAIDRQIATLGVRAFVRPMTYLDAGPLLEHVRDLLREAT